MIMGILRMYYIMVKFIRALKILNVYFYQCWYSHVFLRHRVQIVCFGWTVVVKSQATDHLLIYIFLFCIYVCPL